MTKRHLRLERFEDRRLMAGVLIQETLNRSLVNDNSWGADWYTVALTSAPSSPVQIDVVSDPAKLNIFGNPLVFDATNWSTPQTVYMQGANNSAVTGTQTAIISHSITTTASEYLGISVRDVQATIIDTDYQPYSIAYDYQLIEGGSEGLFFGVRDFVNSGTGFVYTTDNQVTIEPLNGSNSTLAIRAINDGIEESTHVGRVMFTPEGPNPNNFSIPDLLVEISDSRDIQLVSKSVNNGEAQRSMLTSIAITFNAPIVVEPSGVSLTDMNTGAVISLNLSVSDRVLQIRFNSGDGVVNRPIGNSLVDGRYRLVLSAGAITETGGAPISDPIILGESLSDGLFRLFGDMNGNGEIDAQDTKAITKALGNRKGNANYVAALDYAGDGTVGVDDLQIFNKNRRKRF